MMIQLSVLMFFSLVGSLFICSFSSIISVVSLIILTFFVISVMYWNLMNMIPLYLFSLFMLGGLYVLIGFVIMGDEKDSDMIFSSMKVGEWVSIFLVVFVSLNFNSFKEDMDLSSIGFSPIAMSDWKTSSLLSSIFIFLIFLLFIFLFVIHSMMKSSTGGGGFVK